MTKKVWYAPNRFESYGEEEIKAVENCLRDGWLAGFGDRTIEFEKRVSELFGKKHGLFVNSGSSAILLGLCALDLPQGSEVVTPACGFATTVAPLVQLGLKPVFCDVGLTTYVPTVEHLKKVVTSRIFDMIFRQIFKANVRSLNLALSMRFTCWFSEI